MIYLYPAQQGGLRESPQLSGQDYNIHLCQGRCSLTTVQMEKELNLILSHGRHSQTVELLLRKRLTTIPVRTQFTSSCAAQSKPQGGGGQGIKHEGLVGLCVTKVLASQ